MDKASAHGAGDCRLESCRGHGAFTSARSVMSWPLTRCRRGATSPRASLGARGVATRWQQTSAQRDCPKSAPAHHGGDSVTAAGLMSVRCPLPPVTGRPRGPMGKASAHGAGDCRFESCWGHWFCMVPLIWITWHSHKDCFPASSARGSPVSCGLGARRALRADTICY